MACGAGKRPDGTAPENPHGNQFPRTDGGAIPKDRTKTPDGEDREQQDMNIILLSGGSGKRLWPLSNEIRSKQFIRIFRKPDSEDYESMVQRVYRQIRAADPEAAVTVASSRSQVSAIRHQLGPEVGISVEPCRRDTFPAIALACAYLHDVRGIGAEEAVVVCPVDPYVDDSYFQRLKDLYECARKGEKKLVLMGIEPTGPADRYGYIRPEKDGNGQIRYRFTEKPDTETAKKYIAEGALWNGGVFAFRIGYILEKARELLGTDRYEPLYAGYAEYRKISFDYAVSEQETSLEVIRYNGMWKDLGTWDTLTDVMKENTVGDARMDEKCSDVHVINELGIPILAMGIRNAVISASPEGILVSSKEDSSRIKQYVDDIRQPVMFAEKSWGDYRVLDAEENTLIIRLTVSPGHRMNYHSHEKRDEIWTVIGGEGRAIVDGEERAIGTGDVIRMNAGQKHTVIAGEAGLQLIETQIGPEISAADKQKYD